MVQSVIQNRQSGPPGYWLKRGARMLDEPVSASRLTGDTTTPRGLCIRNQVSAIEFFRMVERVSGRPSRIELNMVYEALAALPGWSRVEGQQRHQGTICVVFRRDGTDGVPTPVPTEESARMTAVLLKGDERKIASLTFLTFIKRTTRRDNPRGEFLRRLRALKKEDPDALRAYSIDPETDCAVAPKTIDEFLRNLGQNINANERILARDLWQEFLRLRESPIERHARYEAQALSRVERVKQTQRDTAARIRHQNAVKAQEWAERGTKLLDLAVFLDGVWAIRNQICGREFLHEVLGMPSANIREERLVVSDALRRIPGWTRLKTPMLHRGETQFVFRRDGTNGKPTLVGAPIRRRRAV